MGEPANQAQVGEDLESRLDREMVLCLDAVNSLLGLQHSANQLLRQGWMEIASARYAMGPNRISFPLFSLRPCPASTRLSLASLSATEEAEFSDDDANDAANSMEIVDSNSDTGYFHFTLLKGDSQKSSGLEIEDVSRQPKPTMASQFRRRISHKPLGDRSVDKMLEELIISDDSDSDAECLSGARKSNGSKQDPLHMFGALVSPHIRSAQGSFLQATELLVKVANTKASLLHSYGKVAQLKQELSTLIGHLNAH